MKCVEMCDSVAITEKPQSQWLNTLESLFLILIKSSGQSQWTGGSPLVTGNRVGKGTASAILWLCYFLTWWLRLLHWAVEEETVNLLFMGGWSAGIHWDPLLALSHMVTQWGAKRWRSNHVCGQESVWRKLFAYPNIEPQEQDTRIVVLGTWIVPSHQSWLVWSMLVPHNLAAVSVLRQCVAINLTSYQY